MAHIEDRWEKVVQGTRVRTDRYGKGERWRARYFDPNGQERARTFARKTDAERATSPVAWTSTRPRAGSPWASRPAVLASSTTTLVYSVLRMILHSAVADRVIAVSPCERIALPKAPPTQVEPLPVEAVAVLAAAVPDPYRALLVSSCSDLVPPPRLDALGRGRRVADRHPLPPAPALLRLAAD